jgi:histone H3/H4
MKCDGYTLSAFDRIDELTRKFSDRVAEMATEIAGEAGRRWAEVCDVDEALQVILESRWV